MSATQGSKIIVTTRLVEVALMMNPGEFYEVKLLSGNDCWFLFMSHAFESRDASVFHDIESIKKKVTQNCKGLPRAAKTLGGLLRSKQSEHEWFDVLNSKLWELSDDTEIPTALKLSYYHLPSHLKRCFAYCAILPKDYKFEEEMLVHLWMAEGFLQKPNESRLFEEVGHEYFHDLKSRSIFQVSSDEKDKYVMHDLVSDLAQWVSGETCFSLDVLGASYKWGKLEKLRHYSHVPSKVYKFDYLLNNKEQIVRLRTFLPFSSNYYRSFVPQTVLSDLFKFSKLRALSMKGYNVTVLPESIGDLKHLRYLNLSSTQIKCLPKSAGSLVNLQIMKLNNCSLLRKLPSKLSNLINLRYLDIRGASLSEMPSGMRELKYLQVLTDFIVGKGSGSRIIDIKHLKYLRGGILISRLENVMHPWEINEIILKDTKDIKRLQFWWSARRDETPNYAVERHVLNMLQPHPNVEALRIFGYKGVEFPSWLGSSMLSSMVTLWLSDCDKCTYLPSLGRLPMLKHLDIGRIKGIKSIGPELYGEGCSEAFPSLETLCFLFLEEWELWEPTKLNVQVFPRLRGLSIVGCPKLFGKLPDDLSSLEKLTISGCTELVVSFSSFPVLCELSIDACDKIACTSQAVFRSVESMSLSDIPAPHKLFGPLCEEDICTENSPLRKLQSFSLLKELKVTNCSNLVSFPEVCLLSNLIKLEVIQCNALASLPVGMNHNNQHLEKLTIDHCNSLAFIVKGQPPSSMRFLDVKDCEKLEVFDDNENADSRSTSFLLNSPSVSSSSSQCQFASVNLNLTISGCSQLKCISSSGHLPEMLYALRITNAPKFESIAERFHGNMSLKYIRIDGCDNLKYIPEGLHKLNHLERIRLWNCPKVVFFPEGGLPNTISFVSVGYCEKLEDLPNGLASLNSLRALGISGCSRIKSFTDKNFLSQLTALAICNNKNIYKEVAEWGFHNLTSLTQLIVAGCLDAKSFPREELEMQLPPTLTDLTIQEFPRLKYLSTEGFEILTSLRHLTISNCQKLNSLPKLGLPSSLFELNIYNCPLLKRECKIHKGKEWYKISNIPYVGIDGSSIYDHEN